MTVTVKYIDAGTDETQDLTLFPSTNINGGTIASSNTFAHTGSFSLKGTSTGVNFAYARTPTGICADTGGCVSLWIYMPSIPTSAQSSFVTLQQNGGLDICSVAVTTTGVLKIVPKGATAVAGTTVLSTSTWYHVSFSWVITSTTVFSFTVYLSGNSEIVTANAGTLSRITSDRLGFGSNAMQDQSTTSTYYMDDIYVDNRVDQTDPGAIQCTAKRPFANGTTNGFTGSGTPSGYGSGNARYVNEQPLNTTNLVSVVGAGSAVTEEYNIEGASVGDVDISSATIKDYMGWVFTKALIAETGNIIINNVSSNISITTSNAVFVKMAGATTYPAGTGTDIGEITSTTVTTVTLYECGIIFAYIPGGGTPPISLGPQGNRLMLMGLGT